MLWTLLLAVGVTAFMFRTELWLRTRRAYWLYECMHHVTPPGTVLVEPDPAKAARLLATNPDYVQDGTQAPSLYLSRNSPAAPTAMYWPRELRQYTNLAPPRRGLPLDPQAVSFMEERISPAGHRRLVVIPYAYVDLYDFEMSPNNFSWVIEPISFLGSGPANWDTGTGFYMHVGAIVTVLLKPGVLDRKDLSHFTIDYVDDSPHPAFHGTFDIHLKDDDTLSVKAIEAH
jgi:hypothetical protein